MGVKPVQCELNAALRQSLGHISHVVFIQDEITSATKTSQQKDTLLKGILMLGSCREKVLLNILK